MFTSSGGRTIVLALTTLGCWGTSPPNLQDLTSPERLDLGEQSENVRGVLVGAGDIAFCGTSPDDSTGRLVADIVTFYQKQEVPVVVFTAGDNAYPRGTSTNYKNCYDPAWGSGRKLKAITRPSPGNHEYQSKGAAGYYGYFGEAAGNGNKGFYNYSLAGWDIYALNSEILQTDRSGPTRRAYRSLAEEQSRWLKERLEGPTSDCSIAYWHHPRWNSGPYGNDPGLDPLWQQLYASGAEIVITGHEHLYERFKPLRPDSTVDEAHGITQFVVGTGGADLRRFKGTRNPGISERRHDDKYGVLLLALEADRARWRFITPAGETVDQGVVECHGRPEQT
jgi:acid phosphatase type 7